MNNVLREHLSSVISKDSRQRYTREYSSMIDKQPKEAQSRASVNQRRSGLARFFMTIGLIGLARRFDHGVAMVLRDQVEKDETREQAE